MKRIFLELDKQVAGIVTIMPDYIVQPCSLILDCSRDIKATWAEVLAADEIYFHSTFLENGSSIVSSIELFGMLLTKALKEKAFWKSVYCCSDLGDIKLERLPADLFNSYFLENGKFFVRNRDQWLQIKCI